MFLNFNRIMVFILSIALLCSSILAQEQKEQTEKEPFKHALQFYLKDGYSINYMRFISDRTSWRLNFKVEMDLSKVDGQSDQKSYYPTDTIFADHRTTSDMNRQSISLSPQFLYILFKRDNHISIYSGAGLKLGYYRYKNYNNQHVNNYEYGNLDYENSETIDRFEHTYQIGISGILGAETHLINRLWVFAEYSINLLYSWSENKYNSSRDYFEDYNDRKFNEPCQKMTGLAICLRLK